MGSAYHTYRIHLKPRIRGARYYPLGSGRKHPIIEIEARSKSHAMKKISAYPYRIGKIVKKI